MRISIETSGVLSGVLLNCRKIEALSNGLMMWNAIWLRERGITSIPFTRLRYTPNIAKRKSSEVIWRDAPVLLRSGIGNCISLNALYAALDFNDGMDCEMVCRYDPEISDVSSYHIVYSANGETRDSTPHIEKRVRRKWVL